MPINYKHSTDMSQSDTEREGERASSSIVLLGGAATPPRSPAAPPVFHAHRGRPSFRLLVYPRDAREPVVARRGLPVDAAIHYVSRPLPVLRGGCGCAAWSRCC